MSKNLEIIKSQNNLILPEEISEELVWLENFTSKATKRTYQDAVKKFCQMFEIKNTDELRSVTSMHIIKFRDTMKSSGEKNATINNRLSSLSSLFKHLIERQIVKLNPVYGVKTMKKDYKKVTSRGLSNNEVDAILKQPNTKKLIGLRDKAILAILFNVGTRRGTIEALRGRDIYEENGYLIMDMHLKGDKRNKVAVNSHIHAHLKNYFEAMGYLKNNDGSARFNIPDDRPAFPRMSNNPLLKDFNKSLSGTSIYRMWIKYAQRAGVDRTNPHCARATFITGALKAGGDLRHVQNTVGHNDPGTTISYDHGEGEYKDSASFKVSFG